MLKLILILSDLNLFLIRINIDMSLLHKLEKKLLHILFKILINLVYCFIISIDVYVLRRYFIQNTNLN